MISFTLQVIAEARRLGFYSVRGNHDDTALAAYETFRAGKPVPAKQSWVKEMPPGAAEWLHKLPFTIRLPSYGLVVVHAGLVPDVSPLPSMLCAKNIGPMPDDRWCMSHMQMACCMTWWPCPGLSVILGNPASSPHHRDSATGKPHGKHSLAMHASSGVLQVPLTRQQLGDLYIMREVVNTTGGWRAEEGKCDPTGKLGPAWASVWDGPDHVFFGHDHERGLQVRCADTSSHACLLSIGHLSSKAVPGPWPMDHYCGETAVVVKLSGRYIHVQGQNLCWQGCNEFFVCPSPRERGRFGEGLSHTQRALTAEPVMLCMR